MDRRNLENKTLAGLLACSEKQFKKRIVFLLKSTDDDIFSEKNKVIFTVIKQVYLRTFSRLTSDLFVDVLRVNKVAEEKIADYDLTFKDLKEIRSPSDAQFSFSVVLLQEDVRREKMGNSLVEAMEILERGKKVGKKSLKGYKDARDYLFNDVANIDKDFTDMVVDGDANEETDEILKEYSEVKENTGAVLFTGYNDVDTMVGGFGGGELFLIAGYTGDCKTMSSINIAHNAVFKQRKNVVYMTGETLRTQVRRRFVSLHSRDRKFGYRKGLSYDDLKRSSLDEKEMDVFRSVLDDMKTGDYGKFQILQFPKKATIDYVAQQVSRYQGVFNVDLLIVDEARLLGSRKKRVQRWEELDEILLGLKQIAVTHNGGKGIPVITPYQIRRSDWRSAIDDKAPYNKACLANSSEAERSADIIMTHLKVPISSGGSSNQLKCSIIKNRDGAELAEFFLETDLQSCYIGSTRQSSNVLEDL